MRDFYEKFRLTKYYDYLHKKTMEYQFKISLTTSEFRVLSNVGNPNRIKREFIDKLIESYRNEIDEMLRGCISEFGMNPELTMHLGIPIGNHNLKTSQKFSGLLRFHITKKVDNDKGGINLYVSPINLELND